MTQIELADLNCYWYKSVFKIMDNKNIDELRESIKEEMIKNLKGNMTMDRKDEKSRTIHEFTSGRISQSK